MKPVVVLVGRPNVGKSTLFNRLTRSRAAIVADVPGLTRDRQYGNGLMGDRPYWVVDTGGISDRLESGATPSATLPALTADQTRIAVNEADAVVFMLDGRTGPVGADQEIADTLRRLNKPVTVAVNKLEGADATVALAEFHRLGLGAPLALSAAHGEGVADLMEQVLAPLPKVEEPPVPYDLPRVAVVGRPNVGKSTLVNALLGEQRVVVSAEPGTTRDSLYLPLTRAGKDYVLIDTAGVRRRGRVHEAIEKFSVIKTLEAIDAANVAILMIDAHEGASEQDANLAGYVLERGRAIVVAVNKWDLLDRAARDWAKREFERKLAFLDFAPVHYISAKEGVGLGRLFGSVDQAFASANCEMSTPRLNRVLAQAVAATPPPVAHGRRIRLKFAHQGGKNPPVVVVHGNQTRALPDAYRRYLGNSVRRAFDLIGTPVRIECREGDNPFRGKRPGGKQKKRQAARRRGSR